MAAAVGRMWNYQVTAQKPTSVSHCAVGNFTGSQDLNLIIARCTRLEIQLMSPEGLIPVLETGIYGRIAVMELFKPEGEEQHLLFILTERYKVCVLAYDPVNGEIVTRANGDVQDRIGHPVESNQAGMIDPACRMLGLRLYNGLFKVIPISAGSQLQEAFNIRLEELDVLDLAFLHAHDKPTVCVLYQDTKEARHVKTYEVSLRDKEFGEGPWQQANVENGASLLIAVPCGGVLIVGETTITFHNGSESRTIGMDHPTVMQAHGKVDADGSRYLLGDYRGGLHILLLSREGGGLPELTLERIGETSLPSCLSYLDNSVVFIGSHHGDSQLIRLGSDKDDTGSYVEVIDTFQNLGPIVDFCVVDLDRQGQGQIVTCSGAFKDGSLRVIRNGIGIQELEQIELCGVKGVWSLRSSSGAPYDKYLAIAFIAELRILAIEDEEMEEASLPGFESEGLTLYCGNVVNDQLLQVTESSVRVVSCSSLELVTSWNVPEGGKINVAAANEAQLILATGGGKVYYFEIEGSELKEVSTTQMEHEVSCLDISPLVEGAEVGSAPRATTAAVGLWTDITVRLLTVPKLEEVSKDALGGEVIPRSVLFCAFEGVHYLLVGLGDGGFFSFVIDAETGGLGDKKQLSLGTQPVILTTFRVGSSLHVFAASDRPTVVSSSNKKLLYSNVNLKEVNHMCPFNSQDFPDSLVVASEASLIIGSIDDVQGLHKRSYPLGEMPRRIAHQESTKTLGVLTVRSNVEGSEENEVGYLRLLDAQSFEVISSFELDKAEHPSAIISTTFADDEEAYYIVGTAYTHARDPEPLQGRILAFRVDKADGDPKLALVAQLMTKGAVYCLDGFNGMLLAGVNSKIQLIKWKEEETTGEKAFHAESGHHGHILALNIRSRGDFILVGDLQKSISLLVYKAVDGTIEEIAHDYNPHWMTEVEILDDDTFLGAENSFNLFTAMKNSDAATDEERGRLDIVGEYHLGEFVNKFAHGSLVMRLPEAEPIPTVLYGTVNGVVGVIASLPANDYNFYRKVQQSLTKVIKGVGGLKHEHWRSFSNERRTSDSKAFIDGDLIEAYLDLPPEKMKEVVEHLEDVTVEDLYRKIEDLARSLH